MVGPDECQNFVPAAIPSLPRPQCPRAPLQFSPYSCTFADHTPSDATAWSHLRLRPSPPLGTAPGCLHPSSLTLTPGPPSGLRRVTPLWLNSVPEPTHRRRCHARADVPNHRCRPPGLCPEPAVVGRLVASLSFFKFTLNLF
jgi:hypothetical protein